MAIGILVLHLVPLAQQELAFSRRMGDLYVELAAILVLVSTRFPADRRGWPRDAAHGVAKHQAFARNLDSFLKGTQVSF